MLRIDTHQHLIPPEYRSALRKAGIDDAGGRALPDWSPEGSLQTMAELDVATAIVSVSTPVRPLDCAASSRARASLPRGAVERRRGPKALGSHHKSELAAHAEPHDSDRSPRLCRARGERGIGADAHLSWLRGGLRCALGACGCSRGLSRSGFGGSALCRSGTRRAGLSSDGLRRSSGSIRAVTHDAHLDDCGIPHVSGARGRLGVVGESPDPCCQGNLDALFRQHNLDG